MNFRELLKDWEDHDVCAYHLACCLGIIGYDVSFINFRKSKHVLGNRNSTIKFLYETLERMAEINMLEFDKNEGLYRWNKAFKQP